MRNIRRLCVYCGSAGGFDEKYRKAAIELGARLAAAGIGLVYGGGRGGLMGLLADAVLAGGGGGAGIIPARLRDAGLAHLGAPGLGGVGSSPDRQPLMAVTAAPISIFPRVC